MVLWLLIFYDLFDSVTVRSGLRFCFFVFDPFFE